jgi:hypothetical protein
LHLTGQGLCRSFSYPNVKAYESRKGISTIRQEAGTPQLSEFRMRSLPLKDEHHSPLKQNDRQNERQSDWQSELHQLFERRLKSALTGEEDRSLALFPGYLIAAPGEGANAPENRGILYYRQFQYLLKSGCLDQDRSRLRDSINFAKVEDQCAPATENRQNWLWSSIERPALQYLNFTESARVPDSPHKQEELATKAHEFAGEANIHALLSYIRSCWAYTEKTPVYAEEAIAHCRQWLTNPWQNSEDEKRLSFLFELEAYAGYYSAFCGESLAGGSFGGNWIEVSSIPLSHFRITELCESERLLEELLHLPVFGFAPLVVNENLCVTDGNHRLTAAWLWNLLSSITHLNWDIDNTSLQSAVERFVSNQNTGPVLRHEMLFHLQTFLTDQKMRLSLETLRPLAKPEVMLTALPAVLLPEYLSGAVVKEPYDSGAAIRRAEPLLYEILCSSPCVVLPPRASYHFTDHSLLPWFSLANIDDTVAFCKARVQ